MRQAVAGAEPHRAVGVLVHRILVDVVGDGSVAAVEALPAAPVEQVDAVIGAEPHPAAMVAIREQHVVRADRRRRQGRQRSDPAVLQPEALHPVGRGGDPELVAGPEGQRYRRLRQQRRRHDEVETPPGPSEHAARREHPHRPGGVGRDEVDGGREHPRRVEGRGRSVGIGRHQQPRAGDDPQPVPGIHPHAQHRSQHREPLDRAALRVIAHRRRVDGRQPEPAGPGRLGAVAGLARDAGDRTLDRHRTIVGGNPELPVRQPHDRPDGAAGQSVILRPVFPAVQADAAERPPPEAADPERALAVERERLEAVVRQALQVVRVDVPGEAVPVDQAIGGLGQDTAMPVVLQVEAAGPAGVRGVHAGHARQGTAARRRHDGEPGLAPPAPGEAVEAADPDGAVGSLQRHLPGIRRQAIRGAQHRDLPALRPACRPTDRRAASDQQPALRIRCHEARPPEVGAARQRRRVEQGAEPADRAGIDRCGQERAVDVEHGTPPGQREKVGRA